MKTAIVPTPVILKDMATKQIIGSYSIEQYANTFWFSNPVWNSPKSNIERLPKVQKQFEKQPGETMEFEDADYAMLAKCINEPDVNQRGQSVLPQPLLYLQLKSYEEVILNAKEKE